MTNIEILNKLKDEMLRTYPSDGINVEVEALNGYAFQLSNSLRQITSNNSMLLNNKEINVNEQSKLNEQEDYNMKEISGIMKSILED